MNIYNQLDESDADDTKFCLFTASIANLVASTEGLPSDVPIKTAQELRDEHALKRLERLKTGDHIYEKFVIRGPYNFAVADIWYQTLTMSATLAASIVDFFTREKREGSQHRWTALQLWDFVPNSAMKQVLDAARPLFENIEFIRSKSLDGVFLKQYFQTYPNLKRCSLVDISMNDDTVLVFPGLLDGKKRRSSKLTQLQLINITFSPQFNIQPMVDALQNNTSLRSLTMCMIRGLNPSHWESIFGALNNHRNLQFLNLPGNSIGPEVSLVLQRTLSSPTCRIHSLDLSSCKTARALYPIRMEAVLGVITDTQPLTKLRLAGNEFTGRDLQRLLEQIYRCPNLQEIDLTKNRIERVFWKREEDLFTIDSKPSISLRRIWLDKNPILHNRFRLRTFQDNDRFTRMIQYFPALSQIIVTKGAISRCIPFPPRVHRLLAFHFVTQGRLQARTLPLHLWYHVLVRLKSIPIQSQLLLGGDSAGESLRRSMHASMLYLLLRNHPSEITREAAMTIPPPSQELSSSPIESNLKRRRFR